MDTLELPSYSLRYHHGEVTCLKIISFPNSFDIPILLSADDVGKLILWDLVNRRPLLIYHLQGGVQQLAVEYIKEDGLLALLLRTNKLLTLQFVSADSEGLVAQEVMNGCSWGLKERYSIPVNTMNFANFIFDKLDMDLYRLVCCNTQDSESIDIYTLHLQDRNSLKRMYKGLNFYQTVSSIIKDFNMSQLNKLGIVMKFAISNGVIYCGMESGFVIGFLIRADHIQLLYLSDLHCPNPVLDLTVDPKGVVLSSSIDGSIGKHKAPTSGDETDLIYDDSKTIMYSRNLQIQNSILFKTKLSKIGLIATADEFLILSSWSGKTAIVRNNNIVRTFGRTKSNVFLKESAQGSFQNDDDAKRKGIASKVKSLACIPYGTWDGRMKSTEQLSRGDLRRLNKFLEKTWCLIGYDDGFIAMHEILSSRSVTINE